MISNRVKRNIAATLVCTGIFCIIANLWVILIEPHEQKAWITLGSISFSTYLCFNLYRTFKKRTDRGILFGNR